MQPALGDLQGQGRGRRCKLGRSRPAHSADDDTPHTGVRARRSRYNWYREGVLAWSGFGFGEPSLNRCTVECREPGTPGEQKSYGSIVLAGAANVAFDGNRGLRRQRYRDLVIPGYTLSVKTAISVPDETFRAATERARELGMSRSEFFAVAAQRWLAELDRESLTQQIDACLAAAGQDSSNRDAVELGRRALSADGDDW